MEMEQERKKELEEHRRTIRAAWFRETLEAKDRVKHEEKIKDYQWDR
jgi:hypothetical protein